MAKKVVATLKKEGEGKDFVKDFPPIIQLKNDLLSGVKNGDCKSC